MRWLPTMLLGAAAIFCSLHPVPAEKRVALVIGNSGYLHAPRLENPAKDAAAITELFRQAKFDLVETRRDQREHSCKDRRSPPGEQIRT